MPAYFDGECVEIAKKDCCGTASEHNNSSTARKMADFNGVMAGVHGCRGGGRHGKSITQQHFGFLRHILCN